MMGVGGGVILGSWGMRSGSLGGGAGRWTYRCGWLRRGGCLCFSFLLGFRCGKLRLARCDIRVFFIDMIFFSWFFLFAREID